ncbi:MAG TPA: cellulase family glycosylhydrolase, partial [Anaerolineales bacterium]|nr:cellulase family glycosylhydrolase [Anaerolineales bacterium]
MILVKEGFFKDELGRNLILRGVNLGGSSKVPFKPDGATFRRAGFFDHRSVSFVGRPFPLEQADEHFARLRAWGLTFERLVVPWEAIEHAGPGIYDEEYFDYLYAIIRRANAYDISFFIDPHEDLWSRFSGGDGAPGWTFETAGLDITRFKVTGAAITHQEYDGVMPPMLWPTNHSKLAPATMFTLFFAGNDFASRTRVEDETIQDYLQNHFIAAFTELAKHLKGLPNVIGFDTFNEPGMGYIGKTDLNAPPPGFKIGQIPTPYQAMLLGAGFPQEVDVWDFDVKGPKLVGKRRVNTKGERAWLQGHECIWREHGV